MKKFFTSLLQVSLFGTLFATLPTDSNAQAVTVRDINSYLKKRDDGRNVSLFHRFEVGYAFTYGSASLNINDRFRDQSNNNIIGGRSRATNFNYRSWSVYSGVYFPMTYLSEKSALVLNTGLFATGNIWKLGNISLQEGTIRSYDAKDIFFGAAIGVDYVFGGEATLSKDDKVTLRAGGGLMPYFAVGELADGSNDYGKLGIKPYVKAELGFFAAIEWKIKGMVVMGSRTVYDVKTGDYNLTDSDYYYNMNMKIRPTYSIGITVMPFSFGWESDKW